MKRGPRIRKIAGNGWFWWGVFLVVYLGSYATFRIRHVFVHRAGNYGIETPYYAGEHVNHFIEPGRLEDWIFGEMGMEEAGLLGANDSPVDPFAAESSSAMPTAEEKDRLAREATARRLEATFEQASRARERLFGVFLPAAFVESWIWKVIDPDPLRRCRKAEGNRE